MHSIRPAEISDINTLSEIAKKTFIESHGHSASLEAIKTYVDQHYSTTAMVQELRNPLYLYFLIEIGDTVVGYSKIVLNTEHDLISEKQVARLDRIYILEAHYGKKLGWELFQYNLQLAQKNHQNGMWLHTWVENKLAIKFYEKIGFKTIGKYDFVIDPTHTNPNHVMHLAF